MKMNWIFEREENLKIAKPLMQRNWIMYGVSRWVYIGVSK